jgi:Fungal specific transcription factor domain
MCVLCRDTFSRSDILKRHFQKCSIRRGNPTGASHLSHAQAHLKKSHPGPHKASDSASDGDLMRNINGMSNLSSDPIVHPFGVIPDILDRRDPNATASLTDEQAAQDHLSRSNSLKRMSTGGGRDRRSLTGPGPAGSSRTSFDQQSFSGDVPTTMTSTMNPQLTTFGMPNGHNGSSYSQNFDFSSQSNGAALHSQEDMGAMANGRGAMPMFGGAASAQEQSSLDWQIFQPGAQDGFMSPFNPSLAQNQMAIKAEPPLTQPHDVLFTGMYPLTTGSSGPSWMSPALQSDPLQQIANRITNFCCLPGFQPTTQANETRKYLTVDNIKHFLEQFTNFQGHFPIIHVPTFRITETYDGLLLAMICIGAVYSDRITPPQVRELMEHAKMVIERDSRLFSLVKQDSTGDIRFGGEMIGGKKTDLEELQAIFLLQILFTWHGTPVQREIARRKFHMLVKLAHAGGLTRPSASPQLFSILHQQNLNTEHLTSANFDWNAWAEQEKRSRLFYTIFSCDAAMAMYFNIPPQFDSFDISLPLPADDAAWDARTAKQCADTLGLNGSIAARNSNHEGTRRAKQPELSSALKALMENGVSLKPGTTNLYSKFILIHALHVQIFRAQRLQSQNGDHPTQGISPSGSRTSTPTPLNEWAMRSSDSSIAGHRGNNVSRRATSVDLEAISHNSLVAVNNALDKWKKTWDEDMSMQYPPSSTSYRRFGFCRDGVHFFYLAKYLLKDRLNWQMAPDQRFTYVMHLLKSVKNWVVSDSAQRGEELGSVSDIDQDYGVKDLTLDMAQLFKPINKQIDSPIPGVHTDIGNGVI